MNDRPIYPVPRAARLNAIAAIVQQSHAEHVPLSVRQRAAEAADAVVAEWLAGSDSDPLPLDSGGEAT